MNFRYDEEGRPLGYELYAQTLTEIVYSGKSVILSRFQKYQHRKFYEQAEVLDNQSRVVDLKVSDLGGDQLKLWYHVQFKYDEKGRVIEQTTNPCKVGSGDDYSPIPGKLVVEYDDGKHSGQQKFYNSDGKLELTTHFEYDHDGLLTKLRVIDSSRKEIVGEERFYDGQNKFAVRPGNLEWEVIYDDHKNWTAPRAVGSLPPTGVRKS